MAKFKKITDRIKKMSGNVLSKQTGVFLIFLVISTILWFFTSLNEEVQRQIRFRLNVTNVPDTVTFINMPPASVTASVRGRGTHLVRQLLGSEPKINIDFKHYSKDNRFAVPKSSLLDLIQSNLGDERQIQEIYPDSIGVYYTTLPPIKVPVKVKVTASATPNVHIIEPIFALTDSVLVYTSDVSFRKLKSISTADIHFTDIGANTVRRVPLKAPRGCRAIPDSVDVQINVEPYITEVHTIEIETVNVPEKLNVVLIPNKVRASYRIPKSQKGTLPDVKVMVDYNDIVKDSVNRTNKAALTLEPWRSYIFLDNDSVKYLIEEKEAL